MGIYLTFKHHYVLHKIPKSISLKMNNMFNLLKIDAECLQHDTATDTHILKVPTGIHYLSDVMKDLPKGVFIDKQVCGVGGTTLAIKAPNTNYVIACHRKLLVENKHMQHPETLIKVVGGVTIQDIKAQLLDGKRKIITTYDGISKVAVALTELGLLDSFHLLVDEVQSLIREGGDFREVVCNNLLENSCKFASVSYLTATSTERKYLPDPIKNIPYLKILWEDSVDIRVNQLQIKQGLTDAVTAIAVDHLDNPEKGEAYFFFNSVRGVIPIIKNILKLRNVTEEHIKIICTDNDENQKVLDTLKGKWKPERPLDQDADGNIIVNNKDITFITKTCFEGVDYYSDNAVTYIISDARNKKKHFVKTDIAIDIRQIAGRFRNANPMAKQEVVFLWTAQPDGCDMTEEAYDEFIKKEIVKYTNVYKSYTEGTFPEDFMVNYARTSKFFTEQDGTVKLNKFAYSNIMSEYKTLHEDFKVVIQNGKQIRNLDQRLNKLYDVDTYTLPPLATLDRSALGKRVNFRKVAENYYNLKDSKTKEDIQTRENLLLCCPKLKEYVDTIGIEALRSCSYQESKIKQKYFAEVGEVATEAVPNKKIIIEKMNLGDDTWYSLQEIKSKLQTVYDTLGYKNKAKATEISQYYNIKRKRSRGVEGYLILSKL